MNAELFAANLGAHWIQVASVSCAALATLRILRVKDPRLVVAGLETVLLLSLIMPLIQPWQALAPFEVSSSAMITSAGSVESSPTAHAAVDVVQTMTTFESLLTIVAAGMALRLLWILFGVVYVRRVFKRSAAIEAPATARELEAQLGIRARYLEHAGGQGPSTFGVWHPTIVLPAGFWDLPDAFQRAVICHELLHVKKRHALISLLEEFVLAVLWFHPMLWIVKHRMRIAREQGIDANVLEIVTDRSGYVRCLIEMAGHDLTPHLSRAGAAMIRSRELTARVSAILQEVRMSPFRRAVFAGVLGGVIVATGWTAAAYAPFHSEAPVPSVETSVLPAPDLPAAGVQPAKQPAAIIPGTPMPEARQQASASQGSARKQVRASYPEYPADALEKKVSGTMKVNITINPAGEVSTADVVSGPAELRASAFKAAMGLKYEPGPSATSATIYIEYRLDNQSWGARVTDGAGAYATAGYSRADKPFGDSGQQPLRVGGNIRPPRKIKDMPPVYPKDAQDAKIQGVVILEATVGPTGRVEDARVLRSIPALDQAAVDAVKQWEYEPVLLNGQPIAVLMTVTINFSLRSGDMLDLRISQEGLPQIPLSISEGGMSQKEIPNLGAMYIVANLVDKSSETSAARVSIYERSESGPRLIGSVDVPLAGGAVQSPTIPSFGIEFVSRRGPKQP